MWSVIQSVAIGLLAPMGVWLGWFLQSRDKATDHAREMQGLLRTKAEEIYEEIEDVRQRSWEVVGAAVELIHDPTGPVGDIYANMGHLRGLVHMYFPAQAALFDAFDAKIAPLISNLNQEMSKATSVTPELKARRAEYIKQISMEVAKTLTLLTQGMNMEVKKLL